MHVTNNSSSMCTFGPALAVVIDWLEFMSRASDICDLAVLQTFLHVVIRALSQQLLTPGYKLLSSTYTLPIWS